MPVERAEQYAKWMIKDALSETEWTERLQEEEAEKTLAERNLRIVVTLTVNSSLPKEDEYALIYHQAEQFYDNRNVIPVVCCVGTILALLCFIFLLCSAGHKNGREVLPQVRSMRSTWMCIQWSLPLELYRSVPGFWMDRYELRYD